MDVYNEFATNENLELEGRWVEFDEKTSFKIARANNMNYAKYFNMMFRKNASVLKGKSKEAEQAAKRLFAEAGAKHLLKDWKGPVSINGEDLGAYTEAGAERLLMIPGFLRWVEAQAADVTGYKMVQDEEDGKN